MKTESKPAFGAVLKRYRVAGGLTHEQLAERAGLSVRGISDLERGVRTEPRAYTVRQLAEALHLSADERTAFEAAARVETILPLNDKLPLAGILLGVLPEGELVAREEEQLRLQSALDTVHEGSGQVILLGGELGIGKTRLLQEVLEEGRGRGYVVLGTRCSLSAHTRSLAPYFEALGPPAAVPPPGMQTEVQRTWRHITRAATILPKGTEGSGWSVMEQQEIFGAVTDLLLLLARSAPVVFVLDDLQWADEQSLMLMVHLARATHSSPVFLLGAFRDVRVTDDHPALARALQALSRERLGERLSIRRLSLDETTRLVRTLMGHQSVSEEFGDFVYRRTKGIPRLIQGLMRSLGGRLELEEEIGAGAMGRVFRAYDRERAEEVAAKLVLARQEIDLDALLRFQQEGAVLSRLAHPHIVRIYDTFAEEYASCIIMELLDGRSLGWILQDGPLPLNRARAMSLQVADALSYAHSQDIVHRDIKPDNVMVLRDDQVKVTDFGIARLLEPDTSLQTIATTGLRTGTPLYMAPEQIEGKKIDGRTDIYALGCMLYHIVTGQPPFEGTDALTVAVKHLQEVPVAPSQVDPAIPAEWDALILKAMAKDPKERFRSARELAVALSALSEGATAVPQTGPHRRWPLAVAGLLGVLLIAITAVFVRSTIVSPKPSLGTRIDAYLASLASQRQLSGTVLVVRKGELVLNKGYGFADREVQIHNGSKTRYGVAFANIITVVGMLRLIEGGMIHPQDRICTYLRNCPRKWKSITVRMVIDGTSRLPSYEWGKVGATTRDSVTGCQALGLDGVPNGTIDYQNCDTLVLGTIIEKVTGFPWSKEITFDAAGMRNSGRLTDALLPPTRAVDYNGSSPDGANTYNDFFAVYSTAPDVYAFDTALFRGTLLSHHNLQTLITPRAAVDPPDPGMIAPRWGYLWRIGRLYGQRVIYTLGRTNNFQTVDLYFPRTQGAVIVVSNDIQNDALGVATHTAALLFGQRVAPKTSSVQRSTLDPPLGSYQRILTAADIRATGDTGLTPSGFANRNLRMTVFSGRVHVTMPDGGTVDEYYDATTGHRIALVGYVPKNQNSFCSNIPTETPPSGYYRWSAKPGTLTFQRMDDTHCPDRASVLTGTWTRS